MVEVPWVPDDNFFMGCIVFGGSSGGSRPRRHCHRSGPQTGTFIKGTTSRKHHPVHRRARRGVLHRWHGHFFGKPVKGVVICHLRCADDGRRRHNGYSVWWVFFLQPYRVRSVALLFLCVLPPYHLYAEVPLYHLYRD